MRMLSGSRAASDAERTSQYKSSLGRRLRTLSALSPTTPFDIWRHRNADALCGAVSGEGEVLETDGIGVSRAEPWVTAFLLVGFDIDKGQVVEACVPHNVLTYSEKESISYHAMPDSAAASTGHEDAVYSFRICRESKSDEDEPDRLLLAHSVFRQAPDSSNPRGFFQKAVVVVTSAPCVNLPSVLLAALASKAFVQGEEVLFRAVEDISSWPDPRVQTEARTLRVPFVGEPITLLLPQSFLHSFAAPSATRLSHEKLRRASSSSPTHIQFTSFSNDSGDRDDDDRSSIKHAGATAPELVRMWPLCRPSSQANAEPFHEVNLARALAGVHDRLWTIWELMVLGEPLLVFAPTPSQSAAAVFSLLGLIHPLPFVGDWRPYFCIQDASYTDLVVARDATDVLPDGAVYGVTNCHLVETLPFSHLLTLPGTEAAGRSYKPGLRTTHRPSLHKSRHLLNMLSEALTAYNSESSDADTLSRDVRACIFDKVTRPFLRAFDRYLVPTWNGRPVTEEPYASDPFGRALGLIKIDLSRFPTAEDLASPGVMTLFRSAASRGRIRALYERFTGGPVFHAWWPEARAAAERECVMLHRTDVIEACVRGTGVVIDEDDPRAAECVADLSMRVREELAAADKNDSTLRGKLSELLESLTSVGELEAGCDSVMSDEPLLVV